MKDRILEAVMEAFLIVLAIIVITGIAIGTLLVFTWLMTIHVGLAITVIVAVGFIFIFIGTLLQ